MIRVMLQYWIWRARKRKSLGFLLVTGTLVLSLVGNALTFYFFDGPSNPELTFFDCLWYSVISISTIGYGDLSSTSTGARVGTVVFIVFIGLAAFTAFFGMVLDWFIGMHSREQRGMCKVYEKDHILIINFPSAQRVRQIIEELTHEGEGGKRSIVIVTDRIQELPFSYPHVSFVHGSPVEEETYEQANIKEAREAIILCTAQDDPNSDSVVASIVSIVEFLKPDLHTVAECLSVKHKRLLESSNCDSIVFSTRIANNLMVHESQDKGMIKLVDVITTHQVGDTLYSLEVGELGAMGEGRSKPLSCTELAKVLLDNRINLLCLIREENTYTEFSDLELCAKDVLVYVSKKRQNWPAIAKMIPSAG